MRNQAKTTVGRLIALGTLLGCVSLYGCPGANGSAPITSGCGSRAFTRGSGTSLADITPACKTGMVSAVSNGQAVGSVDGQATFWPNLTGATPVSLTGQVISSSANGIDHGKIVGSVGINVAEVHAQLWTSPSPASSVDLNPADGFEGQASWQVSEALGIAGGQIVGDAQGTTSITTPHAMLWTSETAASVVDLNPPGFTATFAQATDGLHQVGNGRLVAEPGNNQHALLWSGTAASAVDLNPAGVQSAQAFCVSGNQQVGGSLLPTQHALVWAGTSASAVDVNPTGYLSSVAMGTNGAQQVGSGVSGPGGDASKQHSHALVWSGTASSVVDLNSSFGNSGFTDAIASAIDAAGNIVGQAWVGSAKSAPSPHAVAWMASSRGYRMVMRR